MKTKPTADKPGGGPADPHGERTLAEFSSRLGVKRRRLKVAIEAAERLGEPEFGILEKLVTVAETTPRTLEARRELSAGVQRELERLWTAEPTVDPLAEMDAPMGEDEVAASSLWADATARFNRGLLLSDCISSSQAGDLTDRSRQAVERQRRKGMLLALRSGREWRYPRWQFDIDGPGGLLPGLSRVLHNLQLSPFGAALWLTTPRKELADRTPADLLGQGQSELVVDLAEEHGYLP